MAHTDPAYDEYLSTGIDPTGGELDEEAFFNENRYYYVYNFSMKGLDQRAIDIFEDYRVPFSISDNTLVQPHQFAVEVTADETHPVIQALLESGVYIEIFPPERIHRLAYQRAYEQLYGEVPQ